MKSRRLLNVTLMMTGLLLATSTLHAFYLPSFHLETCAWNATHIVVVTEGKKIDGNVRVLESWHGNLKRGETITIEELAKYAAKHFREVKASFGAPAGPKKFVTGARMVLFLKKIPKGWAAAAGTGHARGMYISMAWIELGQVYAVMQIGMSGPQAITHWHRKEPEFRNRVLEILKVKKGLEQVGSISDVTKRVEALAAFVDSDIGPARDAARGEFVKAGKSSIPVLHKLLETVTSSLGISCVIRSLREIEGVNPGPAVTALLERENAYWKKNAAGITRRSFNGGKWFDRNDRLCYILENMVFILDPDCRDAVLECKAYWETRNDLTNYSKKIIRKCQMVLDRLPKTD